MKVKKSLKGRWVGGGRRRDNQGQYNITHSPAFGKRRQENSWRRVGTSELPRTGPTFCKE